MKRKNVFAPSGSKLAPCTRFAATVPPVTFAWYQRTVALPPVGSPQIVGMRRAATVWSTQSDSAPPRFEYCACAIARIESVSAELAGVEAFGDAGVRPAVRRELASGPVKVDAEVLFQSTWNL